MTVTIEDLYQLKDEIEKLSVNNTEVLERLKIIRGYYAVFLHASTLFKIENNEGKKLELFEYAVIKNKTQKPRKYGPHEKIHMSLQRSRNKTLVKLGYTLQQYHDIRKKAEYYIGKNITQDDIKKSQKYFEECQSLIDGYLLLNVNSFADNSDTPKTETTIINENVSVVRPIRNNDTKSRPSLKVLK